MEQTNNIPTLHERFLAGTLSAEEIADFLAAFEQPEAMERLTKSLQKQWDESSVKSDVLFTHQMAAEIVQQYPHSEVSGESNIEHSSAVHRVHFLKTAWFRVAVAVIIFIGLGSVVYLWNSKQQTPVLSDTKPVPIEKNDLLPGYNRAVLTLSDGKTVPLDSVRAQIINDGSVAIENHEGQLYYSGGEVAAINTMTTPKGGQYQLTLADGTKVWLNAASTITYPTAFTGKTREVEITGEAYFEVAKNKAQPFIVKTNQEKITVLGTLFNVNRYSDEPVGKISLIEGAVKVGDKILQPEQAYVNGKIVVTDTQQDIAWKNGFFNFQHSTLEQAMRQLARWYNVEIKYRGERRDVEFGGEIDRSLSLQRVIKGLEGIENLHFELEGKILTVTF